MGLESRWIRLNCDYLLTEWVDALGYPYNRLWPDVLTHVKKEGNGRGSCKAISARILGRLVGAPEADVQKLIDAAISAGALVIEDGRWTVAGWHDYQSTDAERMRHKRTVQNEPEQPAGVTDKPQTLRTNGKCYEQTAKVTDNGHLSEPLSRDIDKTSNTEPNGSDAVASPTPYEMAEKCLNVVAEGMAWKPPTPADVRRHLKTEGHMQTLIREEGTPEMAASLFLTAYKHWNNPPTWPSVFDQRNQLRDMRDNRCRSPAKASAPPLSATERKRIQDLVTR